MLFSDVKSLLYKSEEIQMLPDKWEESIPFRCVIDEEEYDAFLYWINLSNNYVQIKRMICVNRSNGSIVVIEAEELENKFNLPILKFKIPSIDSYEEFFKNKDRYEELYEELCLSEDAFFNVGKEEFELFYNLVGEDLISNFFSKLASDYIRKLQA